MSKLRELANARRRFGYRRLFILLRQQGEPSGLNRIYRLYREEGLACVSVEPGAARSAAGRRLRRDNQDGNPSDNQDENAPLLG